MVERWSSVWGNLRASCALLAHQPKPLSVSPPSLPPAAAACHNTTPLACGSSSTGSGNWTGRRRRMRSGSEPATRFGPPSPGVQGPAARCSGARCACGCASGTRNGLLPSSRRPTLLGLRIPFCAPPLLSCLNQKKEGVDPFGCCAGRSPAPLFSIHTYSITNPVNRQMTRPMRHGFSILIYCFVHVPFVPP